MRGLRAKSETASELSAVPRGDSGLFHFQHPGTYVLG